jgi:L-aminopeptidase/D-esterase-like protein
MENNTLTALQGVKVGHSTHIDKLTGCTVILFEKDFPVAYKSYGGAAGTFNTDILKTGSTEYKSEALFIAGGSLTGLTSAAQILQYFIDKNLPPRSYKTHNPGIHGAIVFDLGMQIAQFDPKYGYEACENASSSPVERGNVGAGTGTDVGCFSYTSKVERLSMKAGVGCSRVDINGITICALSVVNALGNVVKEDGTILSGNRHDQGDGGFRTFDNPSKILTDGTNTTITVVGINIDLGSRVNYERIAQIASHGQIRAISPVNTSVDGDTVFVFSNEEKKPSLSQLGNIVKNADWENIYIDIIGQTAAKAVRESVYDACLSAETIKFEGAYKGIIPSSKDYFS